MVGPPSCGNAFGFRPSSGAAPDHQSGRPAASLVAGCFPVRDGSTSGNALRLPNVTVWIPRMLKVTDWPDVIVVTRGKNASASAWWVTPAGGALSGGPANTCTPAGAAPGLDDDASASAAIAAEPAAAKAITATVRLTAPITSSSCS